MVKAAGIFFTNGKHYLGGLQKKYDAIYISGLGGSRKEFEAPLHTAIRETLEELFHFSQVPNYLIEEIVFSLSPWKQYYCEQSMEYSFFECSFSNLEEICKIVFERGLRSPLYDVIPTTLGDLILNRKLNPEAEIISLALLPLHKDSLVISRHFQKDVEMVCKEREKEKK